MSTTQAKDTVTVHVATTPLKYEGQRFEEGEQVLVSGSDASDLPVKAVQVPETDVAFEWNGIDWDWTPPAPEDAGLSDALKEQLSTARTLLNADPEASDKVQAVDARIRSIQNELEEQRSALRPFVEALNEVRSKKGDAVADLKEKRVQLKLGDATAEDVQEAEQRMKEANEAVQSAAEQLNEHEADAEQEIAALESALERLKEQRSRAVSLAQMEIVKNTADTAHALFSTLLNSLRNAMQAYEAVGALNTAQKQRSAMGWAAKGNARLPARRYTVNTNLVAVLGEEERRLKKAVRESGVDLKPGL